MWSLPPASWAISAAAITAWRAVDESSAPTTTDLNMAIRSSHSIDVSRCAPKEQHTLTTLGAA